MHGFWGVAVAHFWKDARIERENFSDTTKLAIEICQQRRLPWDLEPRRGVSQPRKGCKVVEIDLFWRDEVTGTLSPRFSELPDLRYLSLGGTKVSGEIEALKNLTELTKLDLRNTNVIGDMSSLRSTSLEDDFDIKGTKITCPQDKPLKEVLLTLGLPESELTDLRNVMRRGDKAVKWRLFCRVATLSIVFAWFLGGSCSLLLGRN